jgi:hypothetical protein
MRARGKLSGAILLFTGLNLATPAAAFAVPQNEVPANASCVARAIRVIGPPGQEQRVEHHERFGQAISRAAHGEHPICARV